MAAGKITAAVASAENCTTLRTALERTGLAESVLEWPEPVGGEWSIDLVERIPEVVLLDLPLHHAGAALSFAQELHRLRASVRIIACSAEARPDPNLLLRAMRAGIQDFLSKPVSHDALRETLERFLTERDGGAGPATSKITLVMGAKGGVGATTVAVNLSVTMALQPTRRRVLLLDFGRPLGLVSLLMNLRPRFSLRDAVENIERLDAHFLERLVEKHKSGLSVLAGVHVPDDWRRLSPASLTRLLSRIEPHFDHVLVDFGTFYTSEWKPVFEMSGEILLVTEVVVPALWPLERHLSALGSSGADASRIRLVINRWHRQDDEVLKSVEKLTGRPIFARVPNDFRQVNKASNMGVLLVEDRANGLASKFEEMARELTDNTSERGRPKVVRRS